MESLEVLRKKLDSIDDQIAALYEQRMKVCGEVGEYKVKAGRKVFDRQREKEKLADVASKVSGDFNKKGIQELYQQLMSMSRKLQYQQLVEAGCISGDGRGLQPGGDVPVFRGKCEQFPREDVQGGYGGNRRRSGGLCSASD